MVRTDEMRAWDVLRGSVSHAQDHLEQGTHNISDIRFEQRWSKTSYGDVQDAIDTCRYTSKRQEMPKSVKRPARPQSKAIVINDPFAEPTIVLYFLQHGIKENLSRLLCAVEDASDKTVITLKGF